MKKLVILAAVVCVAVIAQASSFKWTISGTAKVYENGTSSLLSSGTLYLFATEDVTQAALLDAFVANKTLDTAKAITHANVSSGSISATTFNYGADEQSHTFFMAVVDGDNLYMSAGVNGAGQASKDVGVALKGTNSKVASAEWTKGSTFASAGWYKAASTPTPEPTSGLLLVLGMAGLALRRRRA